MRFWIHVHVTLSVVVQLATLPYFHAVLRMTNREGAKAITVKEKSFTKFFLEFPTQVCYFLSINHIEAPICRASYSNHAEVVNFLLLSAGADLSARTADGWTPLHSAARWNAYACVEILLAQVQCPGKSVRYVAFLPAASHAGQWVTFGFHLRKIGSLEAVRGKRSMAT